jgi:hypothetical protein
MHKVWVQRRLASPGRMLEKFISTKRPGHHYSFSPEREASFVIKTIETEVDLQVKHRQLCGLPAEDLIGKFEELLRSGNLNVRYCTDMEARTPISRKRLGLPATCPIWPLKGDRLSETRARVPGIHWPYAYYSDCKQAEGTNWAPFAMHKDDYRTFALNYLYLGEKVWFVVRPSHARLLEEKSNAKINCEQVLRHSPKYRSRSQLDEWRIPYKITIQSQYEVVT